MSMMRSNLLGETSEFRLRSISHGMSSGGLLSQKSRSIAFGNPAGGRLPDQLMKLQLSQVPMNARNFPLSSWYDMEHPLNWGMQIVSERKIYVIERFGKYFKTLTTPGFHFLIPFVDKVAYVHTRGLGMVSVPHLSVVTKDGFTIMGFDGNVFVQIVDPILASYGVGDPRPYIKQLAHASIVSEVGKMTGVMITDETGTLDKKIMISINEDEGLKSWGIRCDCFQSLGLVLLDLEIYKRKRRADNLEPQGERQANNALKLVAAQGDDEAIIAGVHSIAEDITMLSKNLKAITEDIQMMSINLKAKGDVEAAKVLAMIENLGLLTDVANPSAMKGETDQASLPQSKHDAANPSVTGIY